MVLYERDCRRRFTPEDHWLRKCVILTYHLARLLSGFTLELGLGSIQIKLLRLLFSCRGKINAPANKLGLISFFFFSVCLIQRPEAQPVVPGAGERQKKSTAATSIHSSCHPTQKCENQTQSRKIANVHQVPQGMNASVDWIIQTFNFHFLRPRIQFRLTK